MSRMTNELTDEQVNRLVGIDLAIMLLQGALVMTANVYFCMCVWGEPSLERWRMCALLYLCGCVTLSFRRCFEQKHHDTFEGIREAIDAERLNK